MIKGFYVKEYLFCMAAYMQDESNSMSFASLLIGCLEVLLFIWDVLTYPLYFIIQQPWKQTRRIEKTRARIVYHQATEITIRASPIVNKVKDELRASPDDINTMERVFDFSVKTWSIGPSRVKLTP